ncbi:BON domain-containing protein [Paraburkholderia sp. MMS20-SJTN17]|uniref:BON domain-containing protein n=1 Tax=Paraburkholderia translucens TaxID=2886945 RepID=A0ABS8KJQ9_9BURK|nr:BON domain-containing protein [Paraburkholderia sp. MMS20-SJTN17]MCC8404637.1 BON domain-containing protein [Paraburkholderia sp. MMS20-SJTN17]
MNGREALKMTGAAMLVVTVASLNAYAETAGPENARSAAKQQQTNELHARYRAARADNRKLAHQVRVALVHDGHIGASNITVRAVDGAVTLQGSVPGADQIDRASEVAKTVSGVSSVKNALSIRYPGGGG